MWALGNIAKCKRGMTGLVLRVTKLRNNSKLYHGICLDEGRVGQAWQSTKPEWIGTIDDWVKLRYSQLTGES